MIGIINVVPFKKLEKLDYNTSRFPLRTIIVCDDSDLEKVNSTEKNWLHRRFLFIKKENLPKDMNSEKIWDIWLKYVLTKKNIGKVKLIVNLKGSDATPEDQGNHLEEVENLIERVATRELSKIFSTHDCADEEKRGKIISYFSETIRRTLRGALLSSSSAQQEADVSFEKDFYFSDGKEVSIYIQRHTRCSEKIEELSEDDVFLTLSGAMLSFNILKNLKKSRNEEIQIKKLIEEMLYKVVIFDERLWNIAGENLEDTLKNWDCAGINLGLIKFNGEVIGFEGKVIENALNKSLKIVNAVVELKDYEVKVKVPDKAYDIAIIHIGLLEKVAEVLKIKHKEDFINSFVSSIRTYIPNVFLTTGRGRIDILNRGRIKFIPFSVLNSCIHSRLIDKISLINSLALVKTEGLS